MKMGKNTGARHTCRSVEDWLHSAGACPPFFSDVNLSGKNNCARHTYRLYAAVPIRLSRGILRIL